MTAWIKWVNMEKVKAFGWHFSCTMCWKNLQASQRSREMLYLKGNAANRQNNCGQTSRQMRGMVNGIAGLTSMMARRSAQKPMKNARLIRLLKAGRCCQKPGRKDVPEPPWLQHTNTSCGRKT